jgi:hypothetical protein
MAAGAVKRGGKIELAFVGPVHQIAEQIAETVFEVARRAGHVCPYGFVRPLGAGGVGRGAAH